MEHTTLYFTQFCDSKIKVWWKNAVVFSRFKIREILVGHGVPSDNLFWQIARGWTEIPVSRFSQGRRFSMSHRSLLLLPTLSPASHMVSSSSAAPSAKFESQDSKQESSTQQVYLSQSHSSTFLSMEIQLLIIFANQNLHLKNNTKSFLCLLFSPSPSVLSCLHTQHITSSLSPIIAQRTTAFACC